MAARKMDAYSHSIDTRTPLQEPAMTSSFATQAASFAAAVVLTVATFTGTGAIAGHTYRAASVAQLQSLPTAVAATQRVTIVGHRTTRA